MKLGTETGSLVNHLYSREVIGEPEPTVGMGVTMLSWTDRYPGTIIRVFRVGTSTYAEVQNDKAIRVDNNGASEQQTWKCSPNKGGSVTTYRKGKTGIWEHVAKNPDTGRYKKSGRFGLRLGVRERYYDFSF